jgi:tetratricopeptide (TPR) repeat protein
MSRIRVCFLGYLTLGLLFASPLYGQGTHSGQSGGIIDVQVRYADGRPGPRGIHVRLESAEGGAEADLETVEGGKCVFRQGTSGVFVVRIAEGEYKETSARVELIGNPMAYVILDLVPLKNKSEPEVAVPPAGSPDSVSVSRLAIPEPAQREYDKGEAALKDKKADEGAKHFQKAVKLYDNYPQAYRMLGEAYLEQQDWPKAEAALKKSIELEPKMAASYVDLGAIANQQHNYPAAEQALKKGLELSPDAPAGKYELAKTYLATGRWQDAEPLVRDTLKAEPDMASAHVLLANILLKKRDAPGALHEYEEYLRLEPNGTVAPQVRDMVAKIKANLPA